MHLGTCDVTVLLPMTDPQKSPQCHAKGGGSTHMGKAGGFWGATAAPVPECAVTPVYLGHGFQFAEYRRVVLETPAPLHFQCQPVLVFPEVFFFLNTSPVRIFHEGSAVKKLWETLPIISSCQRITVHLTKSTPLRTPAVRHPFNLNISHTYFCMEPLSPVAPINILQSQVTLNSILSHLGYFNCLPAPFSTISHALISK